MVLDRLAGGSDNQITGESEYAGELHILRVNLSCLRQTIEREPARPKILLTVPGFGYTAPAGEPSEPSLDRPASAGS